MHNSYISSEKIRKGDSVILDGEVRIVREVRVEIETYPAPGELELPEVWITIPGAIIEKIL